MITMLPESLNEFFLLNEEKNIVSKKSGYHFGKVDEKRRTILFFQQATNEGILLVAIDQIKDILDPPESDYFSFNYNSDGKIIKLAYTGYLDDDPRSYADLLPPIKPGGNISNILALIEGNPDFKNSIWINELNEKSYINLAKIGGTDQDVEITDEITVDVIRWLEKESVNNWGDKPIRVGIQTVTTILKRISLDNRRNPFLEWVKTNKSGTKLDNINVGNLLYTVGARAPTLTEEEESTYLSEVMTAYMLAVIERQFNPTVVDMALCLIGKQGTGKTTLCRFLGQEWYRSTSQSVHNVKEFCESASGGIVIEFREGIQTKNPETLKDFLDSDKLQYRKAYGKSEKDNTVRFAVILTTNEDQPLIDLSGSRRFAPVYFEGEETAIKPTDIPIETAGKMWKWAYDLYLNGDRWRSHWNKITDLAEKMQKFATISPPNYETIIEFLEDYNRIYGQIIPTKELFNKIREILTSYEADNVIRIIKKNPTSYNLERGKCAMRVKGYDNNKPTKCYIIQNETNL